MKNEWVTEIAGFWPGVMAGRQDVGAMFSAEARVSYPPAGDSKGRDAIAAYLDATYRWLHAQSARWQPVATVASGTRVVDEGVLILQHQGKQIGLPVATVADLTDEGVAWLRIYHSMWPLEGKHVVRPPLLPARHDLVLSGGPQVYQAALAAGDLEGILEAFDPDGCAREPSGGEYTYCGAEKLREFYGALFSAGGGIGLEHCTVTDDGVRCAIEYNAVRWGRTALPPQAGVAVYERGGDGRLVGARIYDDVDPPGEA